jgi:hypothetical protein
MAKMIKTKAKTTLAIEVLNLNNSIKMVFISVFLFVITCITQNK